MVEVGIVKHVVQGLHVMERIGIMVHLLHVVVLEHCADDVLRYVAEGILVLAK